VQRKRLCFEEFVVVLIPVSLALCLGSVASNLGVAPPTVILTLHNDKLDDIFIFVKFCSAAGFDSLNNA